MSKKMDLPTLARRLLYRLRKQKPDAAITYEPKSGHLSLLLRTEQLQDLVQKYLQTVEDASVPAPSPVPHDNQYRYEIREDGEVLKCECIDDPFVRATIRIMGFRDSWKKDGPLMAIKYCVACFFLGRTLCVSVTGTPAAVRVVFTGDYRPEPEGAPVVHEGTVSSAQTIQTQ